MSKITGKQYLMRIFIGENDKYEGKPLHQYLVEFFRKEKLAGTTVLRGIAESIFDIRSTLLICQSS